MLAAVYDVSEGEENLKIAGIFPFFSVWNFLLLV